jgi:transcriptional regulator with XRE-family HTH domain
VFVRGESDEFNEELGEVHRFMAVRVRKARDDMRLSQQELADKARIHRSYLIKIEQGRGNPTGDVLWRLARVCDVEVSYFFPPKPGDSRPR